MSGSDGGASVRMTAFCLRGTGSNPVNLLSLGIGFFSEKSCHTTANTLPSSFLHYHRQNNKYPKRDQESPNLLENESTTLCEKYLEKKSN